MSVTINGSTGVSLVQNGVLTDANMPAGSVLQVVNATYSTSTSTTSSAFTDLGLSASITPSSASNKIFIVASINGVYKTGHNGSIGLVLVRGVTEIVRFSDNGLSYTGDTTASQTAGSINYLDSPSTTSSTTYKIQFKNGASSGGSVVVNDGGGNVVSAITLMEIAA